MLGGMIDRAIDRTLVQTAIRRSRIVALLGPRQCGKTTLAHSFSRTSLERDIPQLAGCG